MKRRAFLAGLASGAAALPLAGIGGIAFGQDAPRFRAIVVDTKPLEARGARGAASILRPQLQASLQREFSGLIGRGGPALVVRLETVYLAPQIDFGDGRRGGTALWDYLTGHVTAGRQSFPLFVTQSPSVGGDWTSPDFEPRRLRALADQYAGWVRRKV